MKIIVAAVIIDMNTSCFFQFKSSSSLTNFLMWFDIGVLSKNANISAINAPMIQPKMI